MHIGIDLRGLNFPHTTGIGAYTKALLSHLPKNHKYTGIGLKKTYQEVIKSLINGEITFISMQEYTGSMLHNNSKISMINYCISTKLSIYNNAFQSFDYLILPQPKPIQIHPKTKLITVIHDCFSVLHDHQTTLNHRLLENKNFYKLLCEKSTKVVVNSYATGYDLQRFLNIDSSKISLIYPADIGEKMISNQTKNSDYFVAISGIEYRKNWINLIEGFKLFSKDNPKYKLKLIGKPIQKNYLKLVQKAINGHPQIELILNCSEITKQKLLSNCIALVYPSLYEGFGFPILEAQRYGKPVITSKISSMPEIAGLGGVYINPFNIKEIESAISLICKDEAYKNEIIRHSKLNYKRFDWTDFENKWLNLLT